MTLFVELEMVTFSVGFDPDFSSAVEFGSVFGLKSSRSELIFFSEDKYNYVTYTLLKNVNEIHDHKNKILASTEILKCKVAYIHRGLNWFVCIEVCMYGDLYVSTYCGLDFLGN